MVAVGRLRLWGAQGECGRGSRCNGGSSTWRNRSRLAAATAARQGHLQAVVAAARLLSDGCQVVGGLGGVDLAAHDAAGGKGGRRQVEQGLRLLGVLAWLPANAAQCIAKHASVLWDCMSCISIRYFAQYRISHLMKAPENDQAEDRPLYSLRVVGMRITVLFICKEQEEGRAGDADVS